MKDKFILDACCGSRCFWLDKHHPNVVYIDKRIEEKGFIWSRGNREIKPDIVMDNRDLKFPDKSFKLIVFDPPHLISKGFNNSMMGKTYGTLDDNTWKDDIKRAFDECWRVLDDYGVLIFKWNEQSISKKEVLEVIGKPYLFGHPVGSKVNTIWFCFMKIPEEKL
jgi:hypothetical protein